MCICGRFGFVMGARVCLGVVLGAFGVHGAVRLRSFCERAEDIFAYGVLEDAQGQRNFVLSRERTIKDGFVARIEGLITRSQSEALAGTKLFTARENLPETKDMDKFYLTDLVGLAAYDDQGAHIGKVSAVFNHGAGDILEISGTDKRMHLVFFSRDNVPEIDLAAGQLVVSLPAET